MADYIDIEKQEQEESSGIDFRKLWSIVVLNWYWLVFSTLFCAALAYVYLRYQNPVYRASAKILVKDDNGKSRGRSQELTLDQLGLISNSNGFENEMEIIKSTAVATRAVKALKIYVVYVTQGRVRKAELYKTSPILVDLEESRLDLLKRPVEIEITKKGENGIHVEITLDAKMNEKEVISRDLNEFPCYVSTRVGKIMFSRNPGFEMSDRPLNVTIVPPVLMGRAYARNLQANPTSKMTSVAELSLLDTQVERALDYLAQLVDSYNEDANEDKNEVANKTEDFIKGRIDVIQSELNATESDIEAYKRGNSLVNLPTDASQALLQTNEFQKQQVEIQTQMSLVKSLIDYVQNPGNYMSLIPANIGISNQATNEMVKLYNDLVLQRNRLLRGATESNPRVIQVTEELETRWDAVGKQLNSIYNDLQIQKNSADQQYNRFADRVSSTPTQERNMNNMGRQQEIKAGLYLLLLQKREENYISLASTANKARVIDMPQSDPSPVSPKRRLILLAALLFGLFAPLAWFYVRDLLRFRIEGRNDLEKMTKLSILADIPLTDELAKGERAIVVKENTNDMMEESFRGLRTNMRFVLPAGEKVILTTSSMPGEGKTFVATNFAMSLALLGKHVLIMGLDIRKPRLVQLFGLPQTKKGITNFLASDTEDFKLLEDQIIRKVENDNLDVLPAGIIPPNPGELITRDLLDKGIEYLKNLYDYIIIDTPPVGLVSDTFELGRLANVTFFIVRSEKTTKADVESINRLNTEGKLPKINLVLNGVDLTKRKYGFYYGYGKYSSYSKYGTYYGRYGHYGTYGNYGDKSQRLEK